MRNGNPKFNLSLAESSVKACARPSTRRRRERRESAEKTNAEKGKNDEFDASWA
jgi:hypothetical protein